MHVKRLYLEEPRPPREPPPEPPLRPPRDEFPPPLRPPELKPPFPPLEPPREPPLGAEAPSPPASLLRATCARNFGLDFAPPGLYPAPEPAPFEAP